MRLDLLNITKTISQKEIEEQINFLNNKYDLSIKSFSLE